MSFRRPIALTTSLSFSLAVLAGSLGLPGARAQAPARTKAAPAAKAATKTDLNTASSEELVANLPGIGPVTARKIIEGRPFAKVEDLARVGVSARLIENLRPLVTISAPAPAVPKAAPAAEAPAAKAMEKAKAVAASPAAAGPVDVNTASAEQLQELPGIGPVAAQAIIAARPFKSVDDLERVRGLGAAKINALRGRVTVVGTTAPAATKAMTRSAAPPAARLTPGQIVNINTAPKEVLDLLPGIGPVKAQAIIESRPFKTREDIMKVKGIKEGEFSKIKDMITVN
ncbi:MAG: helix-hairpin-helix domain-containing protein [Isosphaeraceae bacterium]